jgi:hypothetical protein
LSVKGTNTSHIINNKYVLFSTFYPQYSTSGQL